MDILREPVLDYTTCIAAVWAAKRSQYATVYVCLLNSSTVFDPWACIVLLMSYAVYIC